MITESIVSEYIPKYLWEELLIDKLICSCVRNYSLTGLFFEAFFICISLYGKKWYKKRMDNQEDSTIKTIEPIKNLVGHSLKYINSVNGLN